VQQSCACVCVAGFSPVYGGEQTRHEGVRELAAQAGHGPRFADGVCAGRLGHEVRRFDAAVRETMHNCTRWPLRHRYRRGRVSAVLQCMGLHGHTHFCRCPSRVHAARATPGARVRTRFIANYKATVAFAESGTTHCDRHSAGHAKSACGCRWCSTRSGAD
jgi:hypothetical protein